MNKQKNKDDRLGDEKDKEQEETAKTRTVGAGGGKKRVEGVR